MKTNSNSKDALNAPPKDHFGPSGEQQRNILDRQHDGFSSSKQGQQKQPHHQQQKQKQHGKKGERLATGAFRFTNGTTTSGDRKDGSNAPRATPDASKGAPSLGSATVGLETSTSSGSSSSSTLTETPAALAFAEEGSSATSPHSPHLPPLSSQQKQTEAKRDGNGTTKQVPANQRCGEKQNQPSSNQNDFANIRPQQCYNAQPKRNDASPNSALACFSTTDEKDMERLIDQDPLIQQALFRTMEQQSHGDPASEQQPGVATQRKNLAEQKGPPPAHPAQAMFVPSVSGFSPALSSPQLPFNANGNNWLQQFASPNQLTSLLMQLVSASGIQAPPAAAVQGAAAAKTTVSPTGPTTAAPPPTIPCRARGMPSAHAFKTAFFTIRPDIKHGADLICSFPACRDGGVKFRYCAYCRVPVAKRNFRVRHAHEKEEAAAGVVSSAKRSRKRKAVPPKQDSPKRPKHEEATNLANEKTSPMLEGAECNQKAHSGNAPIIEPSCTVDNGANEDKNHRKPDKKEPKKGSHAKAKGGAPMIESLEMVDKYVSKNRPSEDKPKRKHKKAKKAKKFDPSRHQASGGDLKMSLQESEEARNVSGGSDGDGDVYTNDRVSQWALLLRMRPRNCDDEAMSAWMEEVMAISDVGVPILPNMSDLSDSFDKTWRRNKKRPKKSTA